MLAQANALPQSVLQALLKRRCSDQDTKLPAHCSKHLKLGSIHNTKLYLKKLYAYLANAGLSKNNYEELLSFKAVRGTRIYPAASPSDLAQILEQVDRRIPIGKRNYCNHLAWRSNRASSDRYNPVGAFRH